MLRGNRARPAVMCWGFCGLPTVVGSRSHHSLPFIHTSGDKGLVLGRVGAGMAPRAPLGVVRTWHRNSKDIASCLPPTLSPPLAAESNVNCFGRIQMKIL